MWRDTDNLALTGTSLSLHTLNRKVLWIPVAGRETNPNFMNGVPELLILTLLQQDEMYGYEIVQAIRERTGAVIAIGEGVVYPVLHGLERDGALRTRRKRVNGRSRIYYSVTPSGSRRLADLSQTWVNLTTAIQAMLIGAQYGDAIS
jgi:PadR family transcriptional regulator, regulatory protein PadR